MRSATAGEIALLAGIGYNVYVRVWIANADGTFKDLSTLSAINWIEHVELDGDIDQPIAACTLYLKRDIGSSLSLAPLRTDSPLNVRDDGVTFASLVDVGRDMYVETATVAIGGTPGISDWKQLFRGITDVVKANDVVMEVNCRDLGAYLADAWFAAAQGFTFDPAVGEAIETLVQTVLDNGGMDGRVATVTLYTPVSPGEQITAFKYDIEPVLDAVIRLVQGIGWDVRYLWDEGTSTFRFTLSDPGRSKTTPDMTVGPDQYITIPNFALDRTDVRNSITGTWGPADARLSKLYEDGTSISRYKKRSITFNEASDSAIDTEVEMDRMAAAALSDLKDPRADQQIEMLFNWRVELRDLLRFSANGVQYNTNQDLSIVRYKHILGGNGGTQHRSIVDVRGSPAGSYLNWIARAANGQAVVLNPSLLRILRISSTESSDGTSRNFVLTVGTLVTALHVHYRTVSVDETQDTHDFSETAVLPVDPGSPLILRPAGRLVTFSLSQPGRGRLLAARFVPYSTDVGEGDSVPVTIDAAPPAINATIHATKVGALANLSIDIAFGVSDGPVSVAVIERLLGVPTTLLTLAMTAPGTIDWTTYPGLANRPIPSDADSLSWTVQITDAASEVWVFGPTVALPSVVNITATPSESAGVGTVTVVITDVGNYLDPTHVDGSVTSQLSWHVTRLGVTTVVASTTAPGGTTGTYTLVETLDPLHPIQVAGFVHYVDGSTESFGSWAFDSDKIADVVNASIAKISGVATVTVVWDTDALVGANCARYSLDGGSTWTSTVTISSGYLSQFTIAQTAAKQTLIIEAKNAVDGGATYGHQTDGQARTIEIDAYNPATGQGTIAVGADGNWVATIDGPVDALSFKWSSSTSAFPVDATVASGGTLVTGTGRLLAMSGGPLTAGQTVYITAIPFSAVSAGGTQLPSIHLQSDIFAPGSAQGTVLFDTNGNWKGTADGPANALSFRWTASTSSFPVDATVAASGTLVSGTGRLLSMSGGPQAFGDTVYITVIPFSAVSGGGVALPSIHIFGAYQTFTSPKKVRVSPPEFVYSSGPSIVQQLGYINPSTTGSGVYFAGLKGVPTGVTINKFNASAYRAAGLGTITFQVYRLSASGVATGPIGGSVLTHTTTGWQTLTISVTETTTGEVYYLYAVLEQGGETLPSDVRLAYGEAEYTAPDPSKPGAG